jgi:hypothetical protein
MTEDPGNLKPQRPKHFLARAIGGGLGAATGIAVSKLTGFDSFWPWMVLVVGCTGIGVFLAQKIASKQRAVYPTPIKPAVTMSKKHSLTEIFLFRLASSEAEFRLNF